MNTFQEPVAMRVSIDFTKFLEVLSNKLDISMLEDNHIHSLKDFHNYLYIYKEILYELSLSDEEKSLAFDSLCSSMEFLVCLIQGKYKLASMALRGSMETYAKALILTTEATATTKFANNIEISFKNIIENICRTESLNFRSCKNFKKSMNSSYADILKSEYRNLSDIVHSRTTKFNSFSEFLDDVLVNQFDQGIFESLLNKGTFIIIYFIEILIIANYKTLDSTMNFLKFDYINGNLSEKFKHLKNIFI